MFSKKRKAEQKHKVNYSALSPKGVLVSYEQAHAPSSSTFVTPHFKMRKLTHSQQLINYHCSRNPTPAALRKRGSWRSVVQHPQFPKCLNWPQSQHRKTQPCWFIAFAFFLTQTSFMAQTQK